MDFPKYKNVSSLESIISTIRTDRHVFKWFFLLIAQPAVKAKLIKSRTAALAYELLKKTLMNLNILYVLFFIFALLLTALKRFEYVSIGIIIFFPLRKFQKVRKDCIVDISSHMLSTDFQEPDLCQMTLYQVGEHYSREYKIPSIVDTLDQTDKILLETIFVTFIVTAFVLMLHFWEVFFFLIVAYFVISAIVNNTLFYRRLK